MSRCMFKQWQIVILVVIGLQSGLFSVKVGRVVLGVVKWETQGSDFFVLFALSSCYECVIAVRKTILVKEIHPLRHGYDFKSIVIFSSLNVSFFWDGFSTRFVTLGYSSRSELAITLAISRPNDAFNDLSANSILVLIKLFTWIEKAIWNLPSGVSSILPISLVILSLRHPSNCLYFQLLQLINIILLKISAVDSGPATLKSCLFLYVELLFIRFWSKDQNHPSDQEASGSAA